MIEAPRPDWNQQDTLKRREAYYAQSQRSFMPYNEPLIFKRGSMNGRDNCPLPARSPEAPLLGALIEP